MLKIMFTIHTTTLPFGLYFYAHSFVKNYSINLRIQKLDLHSIY